MTKSNVLQAQITESPATFQLERLDVGFQQLAVVLEGARLDVLCSRFKPIIGVLGCPPAPSPNPPPSRSWASGSSD